MKIVVLDGFAENPGDLSWDYLNEFGEVAVYDRTPYDEAVIRERIADCEIVLTNKTPIRKSTLDACPGIKLISVLGTGYNVIDYEYAREKGVPVCNVPGYGTASVGQHAIALLLEICNRVGHHDGAVKAGRWTANPDWCFWEYPLTELEGKTMGIIGYGKIGQRTARIAKALGMNVLAVSRSRAEGRDDIAEFTSADEIFSRADVISLHCPLFPDTEGIINAASIAKMKDGVIIINNSRGQLIVEKDLAEALNSGKVYAAGLDVVSTEPIKPDNPLLTAKNCIITPHISWAPRESRARIMEITENNIKGFLSGKPVNVVN